MADDLPDDWFRPAKGGDLSTPATPQGEAGSAGGSGEVDERYTDQFKPDYHAEGPRREAPSRPEPAARVPAIPVVAAAPPEAPHRTPAPQTPRANGYTPRSKRVRRSWLGRHPVLATLLVVAVALAVGVSAGQLLQQRGDRVAPVVSTPALTPSASNPSASATSETPSAPVKPWDGATKALVATGVSATCTAEPALDSSGKEVSYSAGHVLDADPATAWRCNGDAKGQKLTFTFPAGSTLVGVGVLNGYLKTVDGESLYEQYRRVLGVEWRLPDGSWFSQSLADNNTTVQQVSIPPIVVDGPVVMTIVTTSPPGRLDMPTRDAVLVSQVTFYTQG